MNIYNKEQTMRKLYVLSKPLGDKPRRLIGELTEENGEYTFEYKLGGNFPEWFLQIDEFPDAKQIYSGVEVRKFINRLIPKPDNPFAEPTIRAAHLEEYDEWGLLKYCGQHNMQQDAYLYENLPQEVIKYKI
jgi:hypothetical protein